MTPTTDRTTLPGASRPQPPRTTAASRLPRAGAVLGLGTAAMALPLLLGHEPWGPTVGGGLFAGPEQALLRNVLSREATAGVAVATGLLAAGTGLLASPPSVPTTRRLPAVLAAGVAVTVGLGMLGMTAVMAAGYALALALPVLLLAAPLLALAGRVAAASGPGGRTGPALAALAVLVGLAVTAVLVALARADVAAVTWWATVAATVAAEIGPLLWLLATTVAWAVLAVRWGRLDTTPAGGWVRRHRRALTVAAALAPAPYVVVRLTWLTPWPVLQPTGGQRPEMLAMGMLLAAAAVLGAVLTLGLVLPWGERLPRWLPAVGGRPVPAAAAVAPGALVAAAFCAAAVPMPLAFAQDGGRLGLTVMGLLPFWAWGPLLGLAVWGYAMHRANPWGTSPAQEPLSAGC